MLVLLADAAAALRVAAVALDRRHHRVRATRERAGREGDVVGGGAPVQPPEPGAPRPDRAAGALGRDAEHAGPAPAGHAVDLCTPDRSPWHLDGGGGAPADQARGRQREAGSPRGAAPGYEHEGGLRAGGSRHALTAHHGLVGLLVTLHSKDRSPAPPGKDADPKEYPWYFEDRGRRLAGIGGRRFWGERCGK